MAKKTHVETLEAEINAAYQANEQHAADSDKATDAYHKAVASGDMDAAATHKAEAERLEALARQYGDRVKALEAQRPEAEAKDNAPRVKQAIADAEAAIKAEADAHAEFAEMVERLEELRHRLDDVHAKAGAAQGRAAKAARDAHQTPPEFKRSRMAAAGNRGALKGTAIDHLMRVTRELASVSNDQERRLLADRERAIKAA